MLLYRCCVTVDSLGRWRCAGLSLLRRGYWFSLVRRNVLCHAYNRNWNTRICNQSQSRILAESVQRPSLASQVCTSYQRDHLKAAQGVELATFGSYGAMPSWSWNPMTGVALLTGVWWSSSRSPPDLS